MIIYLIAEVGDVATRCLDCGHIFAVDDWYVIVNGRTYWLRCWDA